ncbi:MAG: type VI secretion system protein TssA [Thalassobaculaceae bacterium]|nr:type VI secretion system protein TssA [Thalassobaculaceae bacterium]
MADLDDPRLSLGTEPVPGGDPAGENAREDVAFEALSDEVSKMDVDGPNAVDWRKVMEGSEALLRDRSKDFLVAGYYAYALGREEGLRGLAVGLGVIAGIVETFWDTGFPPPRRERARVGAVDWLAERFGPTLDDLEIGAQNADDLLATLEMAERVDQLLDEKAEKTQANLGDLLRPLRARRQDAQYIVDQRRQAEEAAAAPPPQAPASEPAAETVAENATAEASAAAQASTAAPVAAASPPPRPSPPAASAAATVPQIPASAGPEMERAISAYRSSALGFARGMRAAAFSDPRAYTLHRVAVWLPVVDLPPDTAGETMLPAPSPDVVSAIDGLVSAGNHDQVIGSCESATEDRLFWLDPHRHVANALGALGQEAARAAVIAEVAGFLARFPRLIDLKFQGGRPFADDQTRLWLSETVLGSGGKAGDDGGGAAEDGGVGAALADARGLAANGKQDEAAQILTDGGRTASGGRARLLWDLAKADLCLSMGMADAAYSILTGLDERHGAIDLEGWEPALAERLYALWLRSVRRGGADEFLAAEGVQRLTADLVARLYRLNMVTALGIMRG